MTSHTGRRCSPAVSTLALLGAACTATAQESPPRQDPQEPQKTEKQQALDRAIAELDVQEPGAEVAAPAADELPAIARSGAVRLIDVSLDGLFAVGWSTADDETLQDLEGGGHDPRKRGFTVQNVEVSLLGAVDPYFTAEAHINFFVDPIEGEPVTELEEAFFTTTSLPGGLEIEGGVIFTEFGRLNPMHPHQWDWLDQPVILTRLMGPDGMGGTGMRLGWLTPIPWYSNLDLTVQNPEGERMASFDANSEFFAERPIGGRLFVDRDIDSLADLTYSARWLNAWDLSEDAALNWGLSAAIGPNATGAGATTRIYGTDVFVKWRPDGSYLGDPSLTFQGEFMFRNYEAAAFADQGTSFPEADLHDYGFYAQMLYGFEPRWFAGVRGEYATGSGANYDESTNSLVSRQDDPFRDDRYRISPLIAWRLSEYSRLRLQYNYDRATHLIDGAAHSVWLGVEIAIGAHPAHEF